MGEHFLITNSTKVCSLHFKDEHPTESFGIGWLSYTDGAVPSVFAWKRCSAHKRPLPRPRASIVKPLFVFVLGNEPTDCLIEVDP